MSRSFEKKTPISSIASSLSTTGTFTQPIGGHQPSLPFVAGQLTAEIFYGLDIWAEVGGPVRLRYGEGYCLPTGYTDASSQAFRPLKPLADAPIHAAKLEELGESVVDHIADDSLWTPS